MPVYFHPEAEAITLAQVINELHKIGNEYKSADANNYDNKKNWHGEKRPIDILNNGNEAAFLESVRQCFDWIIHFNIAGTQRKSINRKHTAYRFKHVVEDWRQNVKRHQCGDDSERVYTPMLAFCVAARQAGLSEKLVAGNGNPFYSISEAALLAAEQSHQHLAHAFRRFSMPEWRRAADRGDLLAASVRLAGGYVTAFELETLEHLAWWRALTFDQRTDALAAIEEGRTGELAKRLNIQGAAGERPTLTLQAEPVSRPCPIWAA